MKRAYKNRLDALENRIRHLHEEKFFAQWLQEHYPEGVNDYWKMLLTVPEEFRLLCSLRAVDQERKKKLRNDS